MNMRIKKGMELEIRWLNPKWINGENKMPGNPFQCNG
jgi:hypothetical protein